MLILRYIVVEIDLCRRDELVSLFTMPFRAQVQRRAVIFYLQHHELAWEKVISQKLWTHWGQFNIYASTNFVIIVSDIGCPPVNTQCIQYKK